MVRVCAKEQQKINFHTRKSTKIAAKLAALKPCRIRRPFGSLVLSCWPFGTVLTKRQFVMELNIFNLAPTIFWVPNLSI
jgi:hypothetical protein